MIPIIVCTIVSVITSFFVCGVPFGYLISARMAGIDVRTVGSGNIGMTNVARTVGGKAAALTFGCDVGKGLVCTVLARLFIGLVAMGGDWSLLAPGGSYDWALAAVYDACVLGHIFSPYLGFHGGKGISVGLGAALGLHWPLALSMLAVFLSLTLPTGYVSLGSICAALALTLFGFGFRFSVPAGCLLLVVSMVVIWSHRSNIKKLIQGTERRFSLHKNKGTADANATKEPEADD